MNFLSKIASNINPYVPGEQLNDKKYIKLNTNENPYAPTKRISEMLKTLDYDKLRLYPDPEVLELRNIMANYYQMDSSQIFIGNGSDEVLAMSYLAFFNQGDTILFPDITYSFYEVYADLYQIKYKKIKLDEDFKLDIRDCNNNSNGIIIANPNAPTGIYLDFKKIKKLIENNSNKVVIIDEAYIDFGGESVRPLINDYENLLVVSTLSKSRSLAGMRIGMAFGNYQLINGLNRIKNSINSYTINTISIKMAIEAYKDNEYFELCRNKIIKTREYTKKILEELEFIVLESSANFLFVKHKKIMARELFFKLREKNILVRYFAKPRIDNYLRISIGTEDEMKKVLNTMRNIVV